MDLLIASDSVDLAHADGPPVTGTPQYATDGDPATNVQATVWPAYYLNSLMREFMAVLTEGGITPDRTVYTQLRDAIRKMANPATSLGASGYVKLPGGLILQWMPYSVVIASAVNIPVPMHWGQQLLNFPISFPNQMLGYTHGSNTATDAQCNTSVQISLSPSQILIEVGDTTFSGVATGYIFAWGY